VGGRSVFGNDVVQKWTGPQWRHKKSKRGMVLGVGGGSMVERLSITLLSWEREGG